MPVIGQIDLVALSDTSTINSPCFCRVDNRPSEGVYDLEIEGATYDRDNGQFECRMKEGGSGRELHSKSVTVTGECSPLLLDCTQYGLCWTGD